jgi:hypothetical protein
MFSILYLANFVASLQLLLPDKDFEIIKEPCIVCMPKLLIVLTLVFLFLGAEAFTFLAPRNVWVISGVMTLSISGTMLAAFFAWECNKRLLALHQMVYVLGITVHFYTWWY